MKPIDVINTLAERAPAGAKQMLERMVREEVTALEVNGIKWRFEIDLQHERVYVIRTEGRYGDIAGFARPWGELTREEYADALRVWQAAK
jgi:hypothetical protein